MAHPQTPESGIENPGYRVELKDASTQTTYWNLFILKYTGNASTQTAKQFISQETSRDASTQTPEDDLSFLEQPPVTSETSKESRKRKIKNEQKVEHGSDACKLKGTEICGMSTNENSGYNVQLELPLRTTRDERTRTAEEFIKEGNPPATAGMAHLQTPEFGNENPGYRVQPKDASTQTTDRNFFILKNTRNASTQTSEEYISQEKTRDVSTQTPEDDLSFLEQPPVTSETSEESRKISNEQEVTHDSDFCKLPRTETSEMSDQFVSSSSEKDCRNPDFNNIISAKIRNLFESSRWASINKEFSNFEESYSKSKELNIPGSLGNTANLRKEENIASNKNISQNEKAPSEKSDTDVSEKTNVSSDDMLAEQGSSRCHENNSNSKEFVENPENGSPLSQQPPVETKQKEPKCLTCKKTMSEHKEVYDGKDMYRCCHRCCRCLFISDNFECLQMHITKEHTQPFYCDVCKLNYSETSSHAGGGKCDVCKQNFECKYQLEEHYILVHKDFYETHCRICKKDFEKHNILRNKVLYQCCFKECKIRLNSTSSFNQHIKKHSGLKVLKCEVCGYYFKRPFRF